MLERPPGPETATDRQQAGAPEGNPPLRPEMGDDAPIDADAVVPAADVADDAATITMNGTMNGTLNGPGNDPEKGTEDGPENSGGTTEPPQGATSVLDQFNELREDVINVLAGAHQLAQSIGPLAEQVEPHIAIAHQQVRESRLNLVVVGAEGVGKSTLLNTIAGANLSPQEQMYPGTVAPVFLDWSEDKDMVFTVMIRGEDEAVRCRDADEFRSWMLQKENPDNHKQVVWGRVTVDHPILAKGLRLVDMPGVEGLSPTIAIEAQRFIQNHAHAVVAVVRDRGYGALARILENIGDDDLRLQSLVMNWSLDAWVGRDENEITDFIAEHKDLAAQLLQNECGSEVVDHEDIHVMHLPSVQAMRAGTEPKVSSTAHRNEAQRFLDDLWHYVQENGVDSVILDATGAADRAVSALTSVLSTRQKVLTSLIEDGAAAGQGLMSTFDTARSEALKAWSNVYRETVTDSIADQTWAPLKNSVDKLRDRLLEGIHDIRDRVAKITSKISNQDAEELRQHLERMAADVVRQVEDRQIELLDDVLQYFAGHANSSLDLVYKALPILRDTLEDELVITPDSLLQMHVGKISPNLMEHLFKAGTVGSASFFAGKVTAGGGVALLAPVLSLNPIGAVLIGAAAGGFLAGGLVETLIFSPNRSVKDALNKAQDQIQRIDTSDGSDLRDTWNDVVRTLATNVDQVLRNRLESIWRMIEDPGANQGALEADRGSVETAIAQARDLARRLDTIGIAASNQRLSQSDLAAPEPIL